MKEPRKSYDAIEPDDRDESNSVDTGMYVSIAYCYKLVYPLLRKTKYLYL